MAVQPASRSRDSAAATRALATPVQFYSGGRFYRAAWSGVRHGGVGAGGMSLLVALSTSAAYFYSALAVVLLAAEASQDESAAKFFDTAAMLISFVLLGKWLEARVADGSATEPIEEALRELDGGRAGDGRRSWWDLITSCSVWG